MSAITIRPATPADADALSRLASDTFPLGCPTDTDPSHLTAFITTELTPDRFRQFLVTNGVTILLAEADAQLAGFTMLVSPSPHPQIVANAPIEVRKFYVDPAQQGRGVAGVLMDAAIPILNDARHDAAWLSVFSGNARAVSFYKKWGFEIVGTHYFNVGGDPQKDFVMRRNRPRGNE